MKSLKETIEKVENKEFSDFQDHIKSKLSEKISDILSCDVDINERKLVIKVNSKGKRRRKVVCGKGKKFDGTKCVVQKSSEKLAKKKGMLKKKRTQRSQGAGKKKKATRLRLKALKKRKSQGLK